MISVTLKGSKELERKLNSIGNAKQITGRAWNNTSYGVYVQGRRQQAWMHRGRWQTDYSVIQDNHARYIQRLERRLDNILAGVVRGSGNPLRPWMQETIDNYVRKMKVYSPERPNQKYVRTYTLRDNWKTRVTG